MDLPPSGWYPDPYGTPRLLRWWDGTSWTQHTHPDPTAGGAGPAGGAAATGVQSTAVQSTAVQSTTVQPGAVSYAGVESTTVGATAVQPSSEWLSRTKPPTGPRTAPQPALPSSPGVAATAVQSAVQPTAVQSAVQPTAYQPAAYQPTGAAGVNDGGTQVLFVGDDNPWMLPGGLGSGGPGGPGGPGGFGGPGVPGGPGYGNRFGYLEAQRRRRRWMIAGLAAGTAVAVAMIAVIASTLGASPSSTAAQRTPTPHKHKTTPAAPATSASASPTASPTTSDGSLLSDGQSGLSYPQLAQPWQGPSCPGGLNNGTFTWTAGEYAVAGQVNGGSATWYGEACSGPLPVQFGYQGAANLQPTAAALANSFENAYYGGLDHTITPGVSQPISVSGHAGWEVTYQVSYTNAATQGATWTDEQAAVVVVDPGTGNEPSVFFTSVPGNLGESNVTSLVSSLQYSAPVGVTPTDGTPSGVASDGSGGGNPGNGHGGGDGGNHP